MPNVIRISDSTSHGGVLLESGAPHSIVSGKPVALVGDKCTCPVYSHQNCLIVTGNMRHAVNGKAVAYDGDRTSCGALLMSTIGTFSAS